MRLVFVDDPSRLAELRRGDVLVATEPEVEIVAATQGLEYERLWSHVDPFALEADGEALYEPVARACELLDSHLGSGVSAHWHLRGIKVVVEGVRTRWLAAEGLVRALAPDTATLLLRDETLTHDVLRCGLPMVGLEVLAATSAAPPVALAPEASLLRSRVSWHLRRRRRSGSPLVVCSDALYGVEPIAAALRARGAEVRLLLPAPVSARRLRLPHEAFDAFDEVFSVGGLDLSPVGVPRVSTLLERGLPESAAVYRGARRALRRFRPDAVLGSAFAAPGLKAIAAAAHAEAIPVFVSRHGEMGMRHDPSGASQDLDAIDVALCWGEWEARQVAEYARRPVRTVVVGAPSLELETPPDRATIRADLGLRESEVVVLYLPAPFDDGSWIANRASPVASDHELHRRDVLSALAALPGIVPVFKMPSTAPSDIVRQWLLAAAPNARVVFDRPYSELVHLADAVVIDFPSTTLVQALRGSARIFVVDHPVMMWTAGVRDHLTRYGVAFVEADDLHERLSVELAASRLQGPHAYPREAVEPSFASGPETAADRAADAMLEIIGGTR